MLIFKGNLMPGEMADRNIKSKKVGQQSEEKAIGRRGKRRPKTDKVEE